MVPWAQAVRVLSTCHPIDVIARPRVARIDAISIMEDESVRRLRGDDRAALLARPADQSSGKVRGAGWTMRSGRRHFAAERAVRSPGVGRKNHCEFRFCALRRSPPSSLDRLYCETATSRRRFTGVSHYWTLSFTRNSLHAVAQPWGHVLKDNEPAAVAL